MSYPAAKIGSMIISSTAIATQRSTAIKQLAPALSVTTPVLGVVDFNVLDQLIEQLGEAYPEPWLHHMVGVDTVRLPGVLEHFRARGFGAQTRSAAELQIANQTGFQLHELLHSAGVNSLVLLNQLVHAGMNLSIDNFVELSRVDELIEDPKELTAKFGLRVTAQAPVDDEEPTVSYRGIGLRDHRKEIIQAYADRPWLNHLQLHFDPAPATLQQAAEHVAEIFRLAEDIDHAADAQRIYGIHISGGLPVNYDSDDVAPTMETYRFVLQAMTPELFDGKYTVTTNFAPALTAKAGLILARVEYIKDLGGRMIAVTHAEDPVGCSQPNQPIRVEAYDAHGDYNDGIELFYYDIAGPHGILRHRVELPELEEGDILAILDVGGTAFSAQATFTAPVYGIRADGLLTETSVLHRGRSAEETAEAAGIYQPVKLLD
ncbi:MAG TPA: hypothetical protein H9884_09575 [Candidatus Yaniella excrementigallinarum]|nr:hypothetical protein [Candidatus Yaniella excrementigallinarum]